MINFKSLGIAFGGAAMVAGLSYLSKRSSAAKAEVSRKYVTTADEPGERGEEYREIEHALGNPSMESEPWSGIMEDSVATVLNRQWLKAMGTPRDHPYIWGNANRNAVSSNAINGKRCKITGRNMAEIAKRFDFGGDNYLFERALGTIRAVLCEDLSDPENPVYTDQEVEAAFNVAAKMMRKNLPEPFRRGFDVANRIREDRKEWEDESFDYWNEEESIDAIVDVVKLLHKERQFDVTPLQVGALCHDSADMRPKECARRVGQLRDAIQALPEEKRWKIVSTLKDILGQSREGRDIRMRTFGALRSGERHSPLSNLAAVFYAVRGGGRSIPEDTLLKLDAASRLPGDTAHRVSAALLHSENHYEFANVLWPEHRPLAPLYPDLYRDEAARVARGEPIQKVFEPVPIQEARKYWKGPTDTSGSYRSVLRQYLTDTCPDFRDNMARDRFFHTLNGRPPVRNWLASMCTDKDKSRFEAFVTTREFPAAPGETRVSTYLQEITRLLNNDNDLPPVIPTPSESPESFERKLRAAKAARDLAQYEFMHGGKETPIPEWWPEDTVAELDAQGEHLRLLRTCRDIVQEGIELDHCTKEAENYCPKAADGRSVLVSMRLDPLVDEKGATRTKGHRSTIEFTGKWPKINQHYGYRNMTVTDPRALAARDALLEGIKRFSERKR